MRTVACIVQNVLRQIGAQVPIHVDLVAEIGSPFQAEFVLFEDKEATNLRGLWKPWSEYEEGEVVYLTPQGMASGEESEHTPNFFGAWYCKRRSQHTEPGKPGYIPFWRPMEPWNMADKELKLIVPGQESMNTEGSVGVGAGLAGGTRVTIELTAEQLKEGPSSLPYRLELKEGTNTLLYVARGQIVLRSPTGISG